MALALTLLLPCAAPAHPLGNESINHISILWILPDRVEFDLFLDFAEGPSGRYPREIDANGDGEESIEEQKAWLMRKAKECIPFLTVTVNGRPVPLTAPEQARDPNTGREMPIPGMVKIAGEAGAPVYRTLFRYVGRFPDPLPPGEHVLTYEDITFGQYNGLKRIVLEKVPAVEIVQSTPPLDFMDPEGQVFFYDQYDPANLPQEKRAAIKFALKAEASRKSEISDSEISHSEIPSSEISNSQISNLKSPAADEQPAATTTQPSPPSAAGTAQSTPPAEAGTAQPSPSSKRGSAQLSPPYYDGEAGGDVENQAAARPVGPDTQDLPYPILDPRNDPAQTSPYSRQARRLIGLLQGRWGLMVFLTVTALSFGWGAAHALMPGHAKTVVAAYLISRSGNYWHAVALAVIVTITHTALVVVVGLVIWFYQASNPTLGARLQLWLGILAGLLVAGMGLALTWRALTGRIAHHHHDHDHHHGHGHGHDRDHGHSHRSWFRMLFTHSHPHVPEAGPAAGGEGSGFGVQGSGFGQGGQGDKGTRGQGDKHDRSHHHPHDHHHAHDHSHEHGHAHDHHHEHGHHHAHSHHHEHGHAAPSAIRHPRSATTPEPLTFRTLLLLGITGGIVPCPTATIILLLGIGANVVAGALYAVGVFSLGLALTLMLIGFLALSSRRFAARILSDAHHEGELSTTGRRILLQTVPALSGALVVALGLAIMANYVFYLLNGRALFEWLG